MVAQWVDADVDQQQDVVGHAGLQQADFADGGQRQVDGLLQASQQVEQFELPEIAGTRVQGEARAAVDHAIAMGPGQ
ncbi:hypothetical protein D9M71_477810 [compost metagenome]